MAEDGAAGCGYIVGGKLKAGGRAAVFFCLQSYRFVVNRATARRIFNNLLVGAGGDGVLGGPHGVMKWLGKSGFRIFRSRLRRAEAWTCSLGRMNENGSCVELFFSFFARVASLFSGRKNLLLYILFPLYI